MAGAKNSVTCGIADNAPKHRRSTQSLTKYGLCVKCAFKFAIVDRNVFDEGVYVCPNCEAFNKISEMYVFDSLQ
jgi:hypothetical protein